MLFHWGAPDSGPRVRGSEALLGGSATVGVEVGVKARTSSVGVSDEEEAETDDGEAETGDGEAGGPAEAGCDTLAESSEGSGGGELARTWGSGPGPEDQLVGLDLVVCAGVGSCGSVQTTEPSATYHTSLCRLSSFSGLRARRKTFNSFVSGTFVSVPPRTEA